MTRPVGNPNIADNKKDYYSTRILPKWEMISAWARAGLSNAQIAKNLSMNQTTFHKYVTEQEELEDHLREAREDAEVMVTNALFKRAIGFSYVEVTKELRDIDGVYELVTTKKVKKTVAPDVGAAQYWLEHRAPNKWVRNPAPQLDIESVNKNIQGLALLLTKPVEVREIGSENE